MSTFRLGLPGLVIVTVSLMLPGTTMWARAEEPPLPVGPPEEGYPEGPGPTLPEPQDKGTRPDLEDSFQGSKRGEGGTQIPPDTMGAIGPNHFVQVLNTRFALSPRLAPATSSFIPKPWHRSQGVFSWGIRAFSLTSIVTGG